MEGRDVRDRGRIGDAAGLDEDLVRAPAPVQQAIDRAHQIIAHGAADAAVGEGEGVPAVRRYEAAVDVQLSEIVDEHRVAHAVGTREDAVRQGGLPPRPGIRRGRSSGPGRSRRLSLRANRRDGCGARRSVAG